MKSSGHETSLNILQKNSDSFIFHILKGFLDQFILAEDRGGKTIGTNRDSPCSCTGPRQVYILQARGNKCARAKKRKTERKSYLALHCVFVESVSVVVVVGLRKPKICTSPQAERGGRLVRIRTPESLCNPSSKNGALRGE